jgi:acetyltransferase-like isoleucine patch superfamily enzyme
MSLILNIYRLHRRLIDKIATLLFSKAFYHFGSNSIISLPVRIVGEKKIEIGNHVYLGVHCWIESLDNIVKDRPVIKIGDRVSVAGFCTITAISGVTIGKGVLIARFVHISDHSHSFSAKDIAIKDQNLSNISQVTIEDGAWIGHGVVICPGVTIGKNAVIGANSVVRHNIPEYSVAAGVPARVIRNYLISNSLCSNL